MVNVAGLITPSERYVGSNPTPATKLYNYMYYTVYQITNTLNNKIYIGKHQTLDINDNYMGSGVALKSAILKYGLEYFTKTILFVFDSEEEMNSKEKEIVTEEFTLRNDNYNLGVGGEGGPHFKGRSHSNDTKRKLSKISSNKIFSEETKQKLSNNHFSKKDPEQHRQIVRRNGTLASKNPTKTSNSLKTYYKNHPSSNIGRVRLKVTCPFCNKEGAKNTMIRWHFDNCKLK